MAERIDVAPADLDVLLVDQRGATILSGHGAGMGDAPEYGSGVAIDSEAPTRVGERFLEALGRRDYEVLAACFAPDAQLRAVVPPGVREDEGRDAIVARFERWTEAGELIDSDAEMFEDLLRIRYVIREVDPELGLCAFEQTAYAEVADGTIARMRIACSGKRPLG